MWPNLSIRYAFSNVKLSRKLRFFSVAEAHGLIYPRPSEQNVSFTTNVISYYLITKHVANLSCDVIFRTKLGFQKVSVNCK